MAQLQVIQDLIVEINELYATLKTYAAVSRALGGSPSPTTVKKYIIPNYIPKAQLSITRFDKDLPLFDPTPFLHSENWGEFCELSPSERVEIEELWKELSV